MYSKLFSIFPINTHDCQEMEKIVLAICRHGAIQLASAQQASNRSKHLYQITASRLMIALQFALLQSPSIKAYIQGNSVICLVLWLFAFGRTWYRDHCNSFFPAILIEVLPHPPHPPHHHAHHNCCLRPVLRPHHLPWHHRGSPRHGTTRALPPLS